jgi:hypothetical protein
MTESEATEPNASSGPGYSVIFRDYGPNPAAAAPPPPAPPPHPPQAGASAVAEPAVREPAALPTDLVFVPYGEAPRVGDERLEPRPVAPTPPVQGGRAYEPTPIPPRPGIPIYPPSTRPPTTTAHY